MASLGTATLELTTDNSRLRSGLNEGEAEASGAMGRLSSVMSHHAALIGSAIASAFAVEKIVDFVAEAVEGAAKLQKSQEAITATFGASAKEVLEFGDSAAKSFGVSAASADATSAKFGILFQNMGVGKQAAADMTIGWESLAGALEKIKGVDPSDAMNAMTLAAEGNTRGLKSLGLTITGHAILMQAMADGYHGTIGAMDAATKSQAIFEVAMANASGVMDAAKQHTGDLADQQRVLTAEWSNAKDKLGAELLPAMVAVTGALSDFLGWVMNGASATQHFEDAMTKLGISAGTQAKVIADLKIVWQDVQNALSTAINVMTGLWERFGGTIRSLVENDFGAVKTVIQGALNVIEGLFSLFGDLIHGRWSKIWGDLGQVFTGAWGIVRGEMQAAWNAVRAAAEIAWTAIGGAVEKGVHAVVGFVTGLKDKIVGAFSGAGAWLVSAGHNIITGLWDALISKWQSAVAWLHTIEGMVKGAFAGAGDWLVAVGKAIIEGLIRGIESEKDKAVGALHSLVGAVKSVATLGGLIGSPSPYFTEVGEAIGQGLANGIDTSSKEAVAALQKTTAQVKAAMTANQPEIEALSRLIGVKAVEGVVGGVVGVQQTLTQQLHEAVTARIQQELQAAQGAFTSAFQSLAQGAVTAFNNSMTGWVSPAQKILDRMQLADQAKQYSDAVNTALQKINADKAAIQDAGAKHDAAAQAAAEAALVADEAAFHAAVRAGQEYYLQQKAQADAAAHAQAAAAQSAHLNTLYAQLQAALPGHLAAWVKSHADELADGDHFSAASFAQHDSLLSGLLAKLQASLKEHPAVWNKTYQEILNAINALEGPMQDAGAKNAEAHRAGFDSKHADTLNTVHGLGDGMHDALTGFETSFFDAGKSLGDQLAEGLAASKAVSAAGQIAKDISDFFPHSPPKRGPLTQPVNWGWLTEGLDANHDAARRASAFAGAVAGGLGGSGGGAGGGDIVLQVDGETLARITRKHLTRIGDRNGIVIVGAT
jgi:hypothetical protein